MTVGGFSGLVESLQDPVAIGIVTGLVVGKAVGITGSTWLLSKFTKADLDDELSWIDVVGLSLLAGIDLPRWVGWLMVAWFVGGFVYLVHQMPREPRDPWDDGSRV